MNLTKIKFFIANIKNFITTIPQKRKICLTYILLATIIVFVAIIRLRLLEIPLERDEGEFAYLGQLILQGIPPYEIAYNMKLPGIYVIYALTMFIFGQTIAGIHLGLLLANSIAVILLFMLTRFLFGSIAGITAAAGYAFLSLSPSVLGTSAHATQFIVPFVLGGTFLLLQAFRSDKYIYLFWGGLLYGSAFLIKQHAVFFIAFAFFILLTETLKNKPVNYRKIVGSSMILTIATTAPFIITCILLYYLGVFPQFWFWTFTYAREYVTQMPLSSAFSLLWSNTSKVIASWWLLWIIGAVGLTSILWNDKSRNNKIFLLGFFIFSFLTVLPGFYFRGHYFVTFLPAVAMLAGVGTASLINMFSKNKVANSVQIFAAFAIVCSFVYPLIKMNDFFFSATPQEACRMMYGLNPFPESVEIGQYIKGNSSANDHIAVMGSEPQIFFYANRKSATGYIYMYGLMEQHVHVSKMQLDMIRELENNKPRYVIIVNIPTSWLRRQNSDLNIFKWAGSYLKKNYRIVGFFELDSKNIYKSYWNEEVKLKKSSSQLNLIILEKIIK